MDNAHDAAEAASLNGDRGTKRILDLQHEPEPKRARTDTETNGKVGAKPEAVDGAKPTVNEADVPSRTKDDGGDLEVDAEKGAKTALPRGTAPVKEEQVRSTR